jgi:carbon storage regulator
MLVLSRRLNESIIIAEEVRVTVLKITPHRIELGVDASSHISVDREEIHLRKHAGATREERTMPVERGSTAAQMEMK